MKRLSFLLIVFFLSIRAYSQERPNILFIIFDDAGLDMSAYGSTYVKTPGFDSIANDGILFNRLIRPMPNVPLLVLLLSREEILGNWMPLRTTSFTFLRSSNPIKRY